MTKTPAPTVTLPNGQTVTLPRGIVAVAAFRVGDDWLVGATSRTVPAAERAAKRFSTPESPQIVIRVNA